MAGCAHHHLQTIPTGTIVIKYLQRKHIDEIKWNNCINHAFNGNLYGYSWYLDIVGGKWDALVENDYERVFPLVYRRKFGISYIYQPFFTQQLGLYSTTKLDAGALGAFIQAIPSKFGQVEINLNTLNKAEGLPFKLKSQLNHELDLIHSYERIRQDYTANLSRNLRKPEKAGLTISKNIKPDDIIDLFRKNRGKDITHLHDKDYLKLKRIAYTCMYKGIADIQGVYDRQNQLCAGAFFILSNNKAIFLFSGLSEEGREAGAMPFLIDNFIREHAGRHLTFDFDGSNDPSLARFYKSFGSKECVYQRVVINRLPVMINGAARLYRGLRNSKYQAPNSKQIQNSKSKIQNR
jgi:hypothetical protein